MISLRLPLAALAHWNVTVIALEETIWVASLHSCFGCGFGLSFHGTSPTGVPPCVSTMSVKSSGCVGYVEQPERSSKMLGGASQIVSTIRVKCNGK